MAATGKVPTRKAQRFDNDDERWNAVRQRDGSADGVFYFSVASTGVYCRPGCPARTPRRENVSFHGSCSAAEEAGFRACKRCRPRDAGLAARHAEAVARACRQIEAALEIPTLDALASAADMSRFHFHRVFRSITGLTPKAYATAHRSRQLCAALTQSATVTKAIYEAGYGTSGNFYSSSASALGMKPDRYRRGGLEETIRFAIGECSLGAILVAATGKGVCAILLGDDAELLLRDLQDRFPKAQLVGADREFERWMAKAIGLIEAPTRSLDLPLDLRGTAFQHRVWQALRDIPPGATASYSQIAERIGASKQAVRAVASAIGANPLAVAIPCHRVVRIDGDLAGYRWGIARKRALLNREAVPSASK